MFRKNGKIKQQLHYLARPRFENIELYMHFYMGLNMSLYTHKGGHASKICIIKLERSCRDVSQFRTSFIELMTTISNIYFKTQKNVLFRFHFESRGYSIYKKFLIRSYVSFITELFIIRQEFTYHRIIIILLSYCIKQSSKSFIKTHMFQTPTKKNLGTTKINICSSQIRVFILNYIRLLNNEF